MAGSGNLPAQDLRGEGDSGWRGLGNVRSGLGKEKY